MPAMLWLGRRSLPGRRPARRAASLCRFSVAGAGSPAAGYRARENRGWWRSRSIPRCDAEEAYQETPLVRFGAGRTIIGVPLRKDATLLGAITVYRTEVRPFTDKQIALLENFAAQAVIAMENARLITETREALEQQQAIADVLRVINSSPGNLKPIFDILLDKAMQLCGAAFGMMVVTDVHTVAARGLPPAFADFLEHNPVRRRVGSMATRIQGGESFVHILDLKKDALYRRGYPHRRTLVDLGGARTSLAVALTSDRAVLGRSISTARRSGLFLTSRSHYCKASRRRR